MAKITKVVHYWLMFRILWYRVKSIWGRIMGGKGWEGGQIMGGLNTMVRSVAFILSITARRWLQNRQWSCSELRLAGLAVASECRGRGRLEAGTALGRLLKDSRWIGRGPWTRVKVVQLKERKGWVQELPSGCVIVCYAADLLSTNFFSRGNKFQPLILSSVIY